MVEPLSPSDAKRLILLVLDAGQLFWSGHAKKAMADDRMSVGDVKNILRAGIADPAEWERGGWRYRFRTSRMYAVVEFENENTAVVVTVWRLK